MHMSQNFSNKMFLLPELTVAGTYCSCVACFDLPKIRMFLGRHEKLQSDQIMSERERERERHRSCQGATRCSKPGRWQSKGLDIVSNPFRVACGDGTLEANVMDEAKSAKDLDASIPMLLCTQCTLCWLIKVLQKMTELSNLRNAVN